MAIGRNGNGIWRNGESISMAAGIGVAALAGGLASQPAAKAKLYSSKKVSQPIPMANENIFWRIMQLALSKPAYAACGAVCLAISMAYLTFVSPEIMYRRESQ
jgi:hypothetical protein